MKVGEKGEDKDILEQININLETETDFDEHIFSHRNPIKDICFSHDFMEKEILKYNLPMDSCPNCSAISKHFQDIQGACDVVANREVTWHPLEGSIMSCPAPDLTTPLTDPQNMSRPLNPSRPRGYVQVKRLAKEIPNNSEFINMARQQTVSILKGLKDKPLVTQELNFKIQQDVKTEGLISLSDFLNKPSVISKGLN